MEGQGLIHVRRHWEIQQKALTLSDQTVEVFIVRLLARR